MSLAGAQGSTWAVEGGNKLVCSGLLKLTKANVIPARVTGVSLHSSGEPGHGVCSGWRGSGHTRVGGGWWQHGDAGAEREPWETGEHPGPGKAFGQCPRGLSISSTCLMWLGPCGTDLGPGVPLSPSRGPSALFYGTIFVAGFLPHAAQQKGWIAGVWGVDCASPVLLAPLGWASLETFSHRLDKMLFPLP